ncbi:BTAD domain-containing putative transcriptional regulator [Streptomyces sp. NPDC101160]|uniref:AfsR/SARP family transcriptional regulator n=1 Tax=Streptomyces sp. NPDC101160 TaxID=3366118 RepID=UPI003809C75F
MRYLILGTTDALDPTGASLPVGGARLRALLAALAVRGGRTVSVGELVDDVYGDEPPLDAQAALQALVGRLRRVLGKEAVASVPGGYRLVAGPEDIDLYVFEARVRDAGARLAAGDPETAAELLRAALALFRGPALADLPEHAGVRPEAQRLAALRQRIEADLRRGATAGLVPELTELTGAYPYDETFHAQLIRALRAEGRPADALAAYEQTRRTLADGLGTDPGPELAALHAELLAGHGPTPRATPWPGAAPAPAPAARRTPTAASGRVSASGPAAAPGRGVAGRSASTPAGSASTGWPTPTVASGPAAELGQGVAAGSASVGPASAPAGSASAGWPTPVVASGPAAELGQGVAAGSASAGRPTPTAPAPADPAGRSDPAVAGHPAGSPGWSDPAVAGHPAGSAGWSDSAATADSVGSAAPVDRTRPVDDRADRRAPVEASGPAGPHGLAGPAGWSGTTGHADRGASAAGSTSAGPAGWSDPAGPAGWSGTVGPADLSASEVAPEGAPTPAAPSGPAGWSGTAGQADGGAFAGASASATRPGPAGPAAPAGWSAPTAAADPALTPAPAPEPGNIRPRLTSFVGREPDLVALRADLERSRLVTLTGPGGSGKTRLAEEAARQAVGAAAWIAELAPLDDPEAVPGAVLSALRLRETNLITRDGVPLQDDPTAHLVEHLARRPLLLVLDNCEHVIGAAAALAETLLTRCPGLRILATSREPLGVPGEAVRPVEPLPPTPAHRLFTERARAVRPDFRAEAGDEDTRAVEEICRRLDGLPLAIELAAARLRLLTPRQIADRLDDRFLLLTSGSRTVLPRQQTLRAVVDWSWELLEAEERDLLRQASVFAGGWDLAAAEALSPAPYGTADVLGALVDKSLVVATPTDDGEMRYRLLETIHEYAVERAAETPELRAAAEAAHTAYFTALAERAEPLLRSGAQLPWIARVERDLDNIRAALHRSTLTDPDEAVALRLVFAMGWFWWLRNYRPEGMSWVERVLPLGEDPEDPADPRFWPRMHLRMLHFFLAAENQNGRAFRDDPEATAVRARVLTAFSTTPGPESARFPGLLWPFIAVFDKHPIDMRTLLDKAVAGCRRHGGDWETGVTLMFRAHMAVDRPGGMPDVDADLAELRVLSRRVGDRWMRAQVASAAGEANIMRGRHEAAREAYVEALGLAREVGAHAEAPFLLARLAELDWRDGRTADAKAGLDEAEAEGRRHHVADAQTYIDFLRAWVALHDGDVATARRYAEVGGALMEGGTPPPHFVAAAQGLNARIEAHEGAGAAAVGRAVEALRTARDGECAEFVNVGLAEGLALALALGGELALAVSALAAADTWRAGIPRAEPELRETGTVTALARAGLDAAAYEAARAAGRDLTLDELLALAEPYGTPEHIRDHG